MITAIVQARMGSSRFPGKVLKPIGGETALLEFMYKRVTLSTTVDRIIIATSDLPKDGPIASWCLEKGAPCFRGSENDVLDRFYQAARMYRDTKHVVRLTADCALHHGATIDRVVQGYLEAGADYFSNSNHEPDVLEDGFDVEVFSMEALRIAAREATIKSDREHVTPYIKNSGKFRCGWKKTYEGYHYKLSVDTAEDLQLIREIVRHFHPDWKFTMEQVVALLNQRPELLEINKGSEINAGYRKSLLEDTKGT